MCIKGINILATNDIADRTSLSVASDRNNNLQEVRLHSKFCTSLRVIVDFIVTKKKL